MFLSRRKIDEKVSLGSLPYIAGIALSQNAILLLRLDKTIHQVTRKEECLPCWLIAMRSTTAIIRLIIITAELGK